MVKFRERDPNCDVVLGKLREICEAQDSPESNRRSQRYKLSGQERHWMVRKTTLPTQYEAQEDMPSLWSRGMAACWYGFMEIWDPPQRNSTRITYTCVSLTYIHLLRKSYVSLISRVVAISATWMSRSSF